MNTCGAMTRNGWPCLRPTAPGFTRCNLHGGHTPGARQAAAETLARAALPSAEALFDVVDAYHRTRCPTCGQPSNDPSPVIRAAQIILDRTGFGPNATVTLGPSSSPFAAYAAWIPQERLETLAAWIAEAKQAMAAGEPKPTLRLPAADGTDDAIDLEAVAVDGDAQQTTDVGVGPRGRRRPGRGFEGIPAPPRPALDPDSQGLSPVPARPKRR